MNYRNTNEKFGSAGPFEAEDRESLVNKMEPTFQQWADEAYIRWCEIDSFEEGCDPFDRDAWLESTRTEFEESIEEIA